MNGVGGLYLALFKKRSSSWAIKATLRHHAPFAAATTKALTYTRVQKTLSNVWTEETLRLPGQHKSIFPPTVKAESYDNLSSAYNSSTSTALTTLLLWRFVETVSPSVYSRYDPRLFAFRQSVKKSGRNAVADLCWSEQYKWQRLWSDDVIISCRTAFPYQCVAHDCSTNWPLIDYLLVCTHNSIRPSQDNT
jgi:hypothetical protein